ncbi:unnamed protein product [Lymnaea stagnalis]|uniref:Protein kinase domain-containing protein n=1 Tax=Lymnaea stagnalis TaxID=6523 RepID=A0AAV2I838_LYMST
MSLADEPTNLVSPTTPPICTILGPRSHFAGAPKEIHFTEESTRQESSTRARDEELQDGGDDGGDEDEPSGSYQTFSKAYVGVKVQFKAAIDQSLDNDVYSKQENLVVLQQMDPVNFGHVEKVKDTVTDKTLVRKKVSKEDFSYGELQVLKDLNCSDYILKLFGYVYDGNNTFFILLEDAGESLYQLVAKQSADKKYDVLDKLPSIVRSILLALVYLNDKGYVHCDIKPENICVKEGIIKLIDFGSCNRISDTKNDVYTLDYMSPEQLQHLNESDNEDYSIGPSKYKPDHKSDMWAAFMVFLFIVKKDVPAKLFRNLKKKEIEHLTDPIDSFFIDGPVWLKDLLALGLKVKVEDRYTAKQCLAFMLQEGVLNYEPSTKVGQKPNSVKKRKEVTHSQQEASPVTQPNRTRFTIVKIRQDHPSIPLADQTGDLTSQGLDSLSNDVKLGITQPLETKAKVGLSNVVLSQVVLFSGSELKAQEESGPFRGEQIVRARMSNASESSASASDDDEDIEIF